ncbi:helix-turn-helix transcriptional regulator [Nonomuraea sp. NPDC046802]|uniref:helix-turn-helix domain-containing protein n=1 Tax=Nonomuraea sp. NPDC046802 TaxID=3154919 RepID=UPI0033E2DEA5
MRGLTQREAAERAFCDDGDLSKWERGLARAQPDVIRRLDDLYSAKGRLVALYSFAAELCQFRRGMLEASASSGGEDGDMRRRAAMQLLAALSAGAVIPPGALEDVLSGVERALDSHVDLDDWEAAVQEYGHLKARKPVGFLINDLTADVVAVGRLLDRGGRPHAQAGLFRISAGLSGLLASEFGDVGDWRASRIARRIARRAADASGDRDLSVWVRGKEADDGWWAGRSPAFIAGLVDEAVEIANLKPSYGLFRAHTVRAWLAAQRGDHAEARAALRDFTWALEHLPEGATSPDAAFGLVASGLGGAFLRWHEAYARTLIGDAGAAKAADQALALYPADLWGPVTLLHLMRAVHLVRNREIDEGLEQALTCLQTGSMSTARRHLVGQLIAALPEQERATDAARELRSLATTGHEQT